MSDTPSVREQHILVTVPDGLYPDGLYVAAPIGAHDRQESHLPTKALDLPPMPRSAPDRQMLDGFHRSGLPMKVRLFVEADGTVSATELLASAPGDDETATQVMAMFRDTAFSPGRRRGVDVASFIDLEIILEPVLPSLGLVVRR
jgi:hypothetical protein